MIGLQNVFVVAYRYLGEEEAGRVSKESRSLVLLAKLQQKAKEKQKESLTELTQQAAENQTPQQDGKKKRKAEKDCGQEPQHVKKRKSETVPLSVSDSENPDECVQEKKDKKVSNEKQKKKKKKDQSGECLFLCTHTC